MPYGVTRIEDFERRQYYTEETNCGENRRRRTIYNEEEKLAGLLAVLRSCVCVFVFVSVYERTNVRTNKQTHKQTGRSLSMCTENQGVLGDFVKPSEICLVYDIASKPVRLKTTNS